MSAITGHVTSHLRALGSGTRDRRVFAILTRNPHFIEDLPVTRDGAEWVDIANIMEGVLLRFRDGELDSVRTSAQRHDDYYPYPTPQDLITGLDISTATHQDVVALLGEPAGGATELEYPLEAAAVVFAFHDGRLRTVTVRRA